MATFISTAQLNAYGRGFAINNQYVGSQQSLASANSAADADASIFLSHSHKDRGLIAPALAFLKSHGVKVYVDWMDEGMPDLISGETAKKLKLRIAQHKKFLLMVTEQSKDSRWVPWELGLADTLKGLTHIATFPIREKESDFTHNEYMSIYSKLRYVSDVWWVWRDDPQELVRLDEWLRR